MSDHQETELEFPPLPDNPKQPWVERLETNERAHYERERTAAIERDVGNWAERMRTFPGFESLPDAFINHFALRIAIVEHDAYDQGKEHGRQEGRQMVQRQLDQAASFQINALGGYG